MNIGRLENDLATMKRDYEICITSASYKGKSYVNGQEAKQALIRSQTLIMRIHETVKASIDEELVKRGLSASIHPPLNQTGPELSIYGLLKRKKQDIVVLPDMIPSQPEKIVIGPLSDEYDPLGRAKSEHSIVVGVRSQLSSVGKNFDTLMERAFAETLNLRLRLPALVMGEVYLLAVYDYNDEAMLNNSIAWRVKPVPVAKFIQTFLAISGRAAVSIDRDEYKYERSALILADFGSDPPRLYLTLQELKEASLVPVGFSGSYSDISPIGFAQDIVRVWCERHSF